jgi:DNA-binding transcriptional ArsR family regulator
MDEALQPLDMERAFKGLSDPSRLKILGLLALRPRYGEELAEILDLRPATVSHHLARLRDGGLVRSVKEPPYVRYELSENALKTMIKWLERVRSWPGRFGIPDDTERTALLLVKLQNEEGRLESLPGSPRHRSVVLRWMADHFDTGRIYPEREVRRILMELCDEAEAARKELLKRRWLQQQGGVYRRVEEMGR